MPEQENTDNQVTTEQIVQAQAPAITEDKIQEIVKSAITDAQSKQTKEQPLTTGQINELLERQRVDIARSIAGQKEENPNKVHPLVEAFANDPEAFLDRYAGMIKASVKKEQEVDTHKRTEFDKAYLKVLADRPDVTSDSSAQKVFLNFYAETGEDVEEVDRFKKALDQYDVFLEKQSAGDAKQRIEKARGLSLNTSNHGREDVSSRRSMEEILVEEQKEQKEAFLRSRGKS